MESECIANAWSSDEDGPAAIFAIPSTRMVCRSGVALPPQARIRTRSSAVNLLLGAADYSQVGCQDRRRRESAERSLPVIWCVRSQDCAVNSLHRVNGELRWRLARVARGQEKLRSSRLNRDRPGQAIAGLVPFSPRFSIGERTRRSQFPNMTVLAAAEPALSD